ncbi:MAG: hypothetical protein LUH82_07725 [Clostridiales bacterium]|nr:hypothetical protein [Clostridiales bacterium]
MKLNKILKIIGAIVAVAGLAAAVYFAVKKLTAKKPVDYFDDNDFFECDNELEVVEAENAAAADEAPAEQPKAAPKAKKAPAKKAKTEEAKAE